MNVSPKQQEILDYLLEHPTGATLDELVEVIKITKTAVRSHVEKILSLGFLIQKDDSQGVGRPKRRYLLSKEGVEAFPKQYSWLSNVMLKMLAQNLGLKAVSQFMKDLAGEVAKDIQDKVSASSSAQRLKQLVGTMNELGYRAQLKQSDLRKGAVIEAVNCVYHSVAKEHPELCSFDVYLLENVSGMKVELQTCIARGGQTCKFCFRK